MLFNLKLNVFVLGLEELCFLDESLVEKAQTHSADLTGAEFGNILGVKALYPGQNFFLLVDHALNTIKCRLVR